MSKKKTRTTTKQPGVYLNQQTGNYDIKYSYTEYDPISNERKHKSKWICGINSYRAAVKMLVNMKNGGYDENTDDITLEKALGLWMNKALANNYSHTSIRNTKNQYNMITKFWSPEAKLKCVVGIQAYNCHSFRHTYISNLIRQCVPISVIEQVSGDTQETILKRYSHMFEGDENLVLEALERVKYTL